MVCTMNRIVCVERKVFLLYMQRTGHFTIFTYGIMGSFYDVVHVIFSLSRPYGSCNGNSFVWVFGRLYGNVEYTCL